MSSDPGNGKARVPFPFLLLLKSSRYGQSRQYQKSSSSLSSPRSRPFDMVVSSQKLSDLCSANLKVN